MYVVEPVNIEQRVKMIDLGDYNTIPVEVSLVVRNFVDQLSLKSELIQEEPPLSDIAVRCRLEDYINPVNVPELYATIANILNQEDILCYHATKVLSVETIKNEGIRINAWEQYSNNVKEALELAGVSSAEIEETLQLIKHEKKRKEPNGRDRLCYFSNPLDFKINGPGYYQFCQNVGGELARWALEDYMPDVYKILRDSGERVLVKFSLPFNWIERFEKDDIITLFIYHEVASYLWNYSYDIEFDGNLFRDVPTSSIISIIKVEADL